MRCEFKITKVLDKSLLEQIGAVLIDPVSLKLQRRHYCDITIHHLGYEHSTSLSESKRFGLKSSSFLFLEGPSVTSADMIRSMSDYNLKSQYGISFDTVRNMFTMTDVQVYGVIIPEL